MPGVRPSGLWPDIPPVIETAAALPIRRGGVAQMFAGSAFFAIMATFVALAHARDAHLWTIVSSGVRAVVNMFALILLARGQPMFGDRRPALWARGMLGAVALITYFAALNRLSVGEAAFLNQTSAIWVAAATVDPRRALRTRRVAGGARLAGIALLAHPRPDASANSVGRALGLLSGFAAAGAYLSIWKAGESNGPIVIVFYFTFVSTVLATVVGIATGVAAPWDLVTLLFLRGVRPRGHRGPAVHDGGLPGRAGPAPVAAAGAAGPLLTALAGWAVLKQVPDGRALIGMGILCVTGIAMPFYAGR